MRGRPRAFDWNEARRLRSQGWSYNRIGEQLGVSGNSARMACDDGARERQYKLVSKLQYWQRGTCVDCGGSANAYRGGSRCRPCHDKHLAFTVRDNELLCTKCDRWLPDRSFPHSSSRKERRDRHGYCRPCQTEVKRAYRQRTQQPCATCGTPVNTADRTNKNKPLECLTCAHKRIHSKPHHVPSANKEKVASA